MPVPAIADIEMFFRVANAGGFRAAAQRYGMSASSLSEAVQRLEAATKVRLFHRTTRSVRLTEDGQRLLNRLQPAFAEIMSAVNSLGGGDEAIGTVRLDVPGIVARYILPSIVGRFLDLHPRIKMEVRVNDGLIDVFAGGCDAGIRYEEHVAADMITVPIGPRRQRYVCVASPSYLATHGTPRHPDELISHQCIGHCFPSGRVADWQFERGSEKITLRPHGRLLSGSSDIEVVAAVNGLGVLYTFDEFIAPYLESGELLQILSDWSHEFSGPFLYFPRAHRRDPALAAFVTYLRN